MADTNTPSLSALIEAGENIFTAITGKSSANVDKVTSGLTSVADGLLPTVESKVHFDLGKVIAGATDILDGVALVLVGIKKKASEAGNTAATPNTATAVHNTLSH